MATPFRLAFAAVLPALLLGCSTGSGQKDTQGNSAQPLPQVRWSDPAAWSAGKVPVAGEKVTLPSGRRVVLDVSPPALAGLTIPAGSALEFAEQDLTLQSEWIMVHGELRIGREDQPFAHQADIVLTNTIPGEDIMGMGDRVLGVMDGTLELHGAKKLPWTRLGSTAQVGTTTLNLELAPDWRPGDSLTLASTDFNAFQTEQVTVQRVSGTTITLAAPLKYTHWAQSTTLGGKTLHERAEVGLLTRNIRIGASDDANANGMGSHVMLMGQSQARVEGAEFLRGGQRNTLRRYPVHFHLLGNASTSYFRNNSVHDSFNRCVTVHGTSNLKVQDNVTFNTVGHCIFLEDGNETGNTLDRNLVTLVRRADPKQGETPLLDSDKNPAAYWITNPANTVTNNVAAGIHDGFAFWYAFPEHPTGLSAAQGANIWPRRTALGTFDGNVAHGGSRGLNVDNGPSSDGNKTEVTYYAPLGNPADPKSASVPANFMNFTAYKQRDHGAWLRGENHILSGAILADNAVGVTFASDQSGLKDSLLIGETANIGQPEGWESVGSGGRSLPRPWDASFPIRGFQFYDGYVYVQGSAFAAFKPDGVRQASGLGYLTKNAFAIQPHNSASSLTWLDDSMRVYFPDAEADKDGDKAATFMDTDGSVTGQAGAAVTVSAFLRDQAGCQPRSAWNASVCQGHRYTRFFVDSVDDTPVAPVKVTQQDGKALSLTGTPDAFTTFYTSLEVGNTYALTAARQPGHLRLGFSNQRAGDRLNIHFPYSGDPKLYRDWWIDERSRLKKVALADLPATTGDSYALEDGRLYLSLVVRPNADSAVVDVCADTLCQ